MAITGEKAGQEHREPLHDLVVVHWMALWTTRRNKNSQANTGSRPGTWPAPMATAHRTGIRLARISPMRTW